MSNDDTRSGNFGALRNVLSQLTDAVSAPSADEPAWVAGVQVAARATFDVIKAHTNTSEAEGGTLPEMTGRKPSLMAGRERLEHEHTDMLHRAEEIETEAERQLAFEDFNIELLRLEATILRDILQLHMLRTDDLLFEAFFRVEGGE